MQKPILVLILFLAITIPALAQSNAEMLQVVKGLASEAGEFINKRRIKQGAEKNAAAYQMYVKNDLKDAALLTELQHQKIVIFSGMGQCNLADSLAPIVLSKYSGNSDSMITKRMSLIMSTGDCYRRTGLDTSIARYKKALRLHQTRDVGPDEFGGSLNNKLGISYKWKGEYDLSIEYYKKAYQIWKSVYPGLNSRIASVTLNMGELYRNMDKLDLSKEMYEESLRNDLAEVGPDHPYIATTYNSLGNLNKALGQYDKAIDYLEKGLKIRRKNFPPNDVRIANMVNNLGLVYERIPDYDNALIYLKQALDIYKINYKNKGPEVGLAYDNVGNVLTHQNKFDEALEYHLASLNAFSLGPDETNIYDNPKLSDLPLQGFVYKHIGGKALTSMKKYAYDGDEKALMSSLKTYDLLFEYLTERHNNLTNESSQLSLSDYMYHQYGNAIETAYMAYDLTKDQQYIQKGFEYAEKGKSFQLLAAFRNDMAALSSGLPEALVQKENDIKSELAYLKNKLNDETKLHPDSIQPMRDRFLISQQSLNDLRKTLKADYPNYVDIKYGNQISQITNIQNNVLRKNELLIEYHLDEFELTRIAIDAENKSFDFSRLDSTEVAMIQSYIKDVRNTRLNPKSFAKSSHQVFNILFGGIEDRLVGKNLLIVPSADLNYVPFEALVKKPFTLEHKSYASLPYLINDHDVSYAFSSTILEETNRDRSDQVSSFLGVAPHFPALPSNKLMASNEITRGNLAPLAGAENEVRSISKALSGASKYGQSATEKAFKKMAGDYDILHLATHAIIDNEEPLNSKLLFSETDGDEINEGDLHAWEIYNMKLKAKMAVLSACSSGTGKIKRGEGAMSLGRAFAFAGCPSTIMSLWPANDQSTSSIMTHLYAGLKEGKSKSIALREAKLSYLTQSDELLAHPFYWAPFVLQGDSSPITFSRLTSPWLWIGGLAFLFLLGGLYFKLKV